MVSYSDMLKIKDDLWKNGNPPKYVRSNPLWNRTSSWCFRKLVRITDLYGEKYEIILNDSSAGRHTNCRGRELIKLRHINLDATYDVGGLDINRCKVSPAGKLTEGWSRGKVCFGPIDDSLSEDYPVVTFGGIKTRAAVRELGEPYLDQVYGSAWRIPCHPEMKHGYKFGD